MPSTVRPADFVKIVKEIGRRCANDPDRLLPAIEKDQNLRVLVHEALFFEALWETRGAALARKRGYVRLPDGFRDALSEWRRRWRHAYIQPLEIEIADLLGEASDPAEPCDVPRETWRLAPPRDWDPEEAIEHPWLHIAKGLSYAEGYLDADAEFRERTQSEHAAEARAAAKAIAELGKHLGGWKAFGKRLDDFEPIAVPSDVAASHGASDHTSLLRWIEECHRAYVFGADMVAVSAARTVLQVILRDHWIGVDVDGRSRFDLKLVELMSLAEEAYPERVGPDIWKHLREFANAVVHASAKRTVALARDLPRLLDLMRRLVENAPRTAGPEDT